MKKKVLSTLLVVGAVGLLLTGCGKGKEEKNKEVAKGESQEIEVWLTPQWKGIQDPSEEGADYDSFFKEAAKRYNEKNPDVKVNVQVIPGEQRSDKLSVAIQTKTLPDVFFDSSFALSEYAHMGVLAPLD
ncbi:extracellular solute-binding protein, partial [Escherichia coli]